MLLDQYGGRKTAVFLVSEEYEKMGLVSNEVKAEWKTLNHYLAKKIQEDMASQLHELVTNETLNQHVSKLEHFGKHMPYNSDWNCLVERSLSQMK